MYVFMSDGVFIFLFQGGKTALHVAAFNGYTATVSLLLRKGADPNAKDYVRTI